MATVRVERPAYTPPPSLDGLHAGSAQVDITPPVGASIGGFSVIAMERAEGCCGRLWANVLVLGNGTERVALVQVDLHAGSLYLTEKVAELVPASLGLSMDRIVLLPSHTHNGPGGIYGFGMYDVRGSSIGGFIREVADQIAGLIAAGIETACAELPHQPARVGVGRVPVWGVSANKSLAAFEQNGDDLDARLEALGVGAVPPLPDRRFRAIDPRVSVIWAERRVVDVPHGEPIGAIGFFGAHGATMSPLRGLLSCESFGFAARRAMDLLWGDGRLWTSGAPRRFPLGLAIGAGADVNVCTPDLLLEEMAEEALDDESVELPRAVAAELARGLVQACWVARAAVRDDLELSVHHRVLAPSGTSFSAGRKLAPNPETGRVSTGASEFGRFFLLRAPRGKVLRNVALGIARATTQACPEGASHKLTPDHPLHAVLVQMGEEDPDFEVQKDTRDPHWPKVRMAKKLPKPLKRLLRGEVPNRVDIRVVKLGATWLATVPFEVSVGMGDVLERALLGLGAEQVLLGSIAGGYTSYVTTRAEYEAQYYEGSSVLWGRFTGDWLRDEVVRTACVETDPPEPATVKFRCSERKVSRRGLDRARPEVALRARLDRDWLTGSWMARRIDVPRFDAGPWLRLQVEEDGAWRDLQLFGAPVNDQERAFQVMRKGRRKGLVQWRFGWPLTKRMRRRLRGLSLRMLLVPGEFTDGQRVAATVERSG